MPNSSNHSFGYQLFMLLLSLYAIGLLLFQAVVNIDSQTKGIIGYADNLLCALFFIDFGVCLARSKNKWHYLFSWGLVDLLSCIPMMEAARWGRAVRIFRIFRVLRGLRATKLMTELVLHHRAKNTFLAATLMAILLITFCSIAILEFESGPEANIKSANDAVWWAITTVTTVGYGDRYPVTSEGRIIATILMCSGVGLLSVFSGFLAVWFIGPKETVEDNSKIDKLREDLIAIINKLETHNSSGTKTAND